MAWNPFRRNPRDTEEGTIEIAFDPPAATCADCGKTFRDSPGNWHIESPTEGICNVCHHRMKDTLRKPYGRTRIGF